MVHILLVCIFLFSIPNMNKNYQFWIFSFFFMFLFSALRFDFGPDYMEYSRIHYAIQSGESSWGQSDILYKYVNYLIPNFYIMIALLSLVYVVTLYYLVKRNLPFKDYWFSVLILLFNPYLYLVHQSSMRQTVAICFVIIAINYAIKREFFQYLLLISIATGFHASAIIMLPVYIFLTEKRLRKFDLFLIVFFVAIFVLTPIFDIMLDFSLPYLPIHYTAYFEQGLRNSIRSTLISSVFFILIISTINRLNSREIVYGKLSLISSIVALLAFRVSMITRVGMYFDIFLIITIPQIVLRIKKGNVRTLTFLLLLLIYMLRYVSFFSNPNWADYYNVYRTIFR